MRSLPLILALLLGASLLVGEAQARGGNAQSFGVQQPGPAAQNGVPSQSPQPAAPAAASSVAGWLKPVTALAAGLGLGWLATQVDPGTLMLAVLVGVLAGAATFALLRAIPVRRRTGLDYALEEPLAVPLAPKVPPAVAAAPKVPPALEAPPPASRAEPRPVSPAPRQPVAPAATAATEPASPNAAATAAPIPTDFDSASFIRQAKLNFIRLQAANDRGDLAALREVTTHRMFDAILAELRPHRAAQHTDVVSLNASLLELATEGQTHSASVRFHGMIRENGGEAAPFEEVWHLQKPVSGASGWVLSGIQQVS